MAPENQEKPIDRTKEIPPSEVKLSQEIGTYLKDGEKDPEYEKAVMLLEDFVAGRKKFDHYMKKFKEATDIVVKKNPELVFQLALKAPAFELYLLLLEAAIPNLGNKPTELKTYKDSQKINDAKEILLNANNLNAEDVNHAKSILLIEAPEFLVETMSKNPQERDSELFKEAVFSLALSNPSYTLGIFDTYKDKPWVKDVLVIVTIKNPSLITQAVNLCVAEKTANQDTLEITLYALSCLHEEEVYRAVITAQDKSKAVKAVLKIFSIKNPLIVLNQMEEAESDIAILDKLLKKFGIVDLPELITDEWRNGNLTVGGQKFSRYWPENAKDILAVILNPKLIKWTEYHGEHKRLGTHPNYQIIHALNRVHEDAKTFVENLNNTVEESRRIVVPQLAHSYLEVGRHYEMVDSETPTKKAMYDYVEERSPQLALVLVEEWVTKAGQSYEIDPAKKIEKIIRILEKYRDLSKYAKKSFENITTEEERIEIFKKLYHHLSEIEQYWKKPNTGKITKGLLYLAQDLLSKENYDKLADYFEKQDKKKLRRN